MPLWSVSQTVSVSGTVVEKIPGTPIPGAYVLVKGTLSGTSTDLDGHYTISAQSNDTLVFSFIGFQDVEAVINGRTTIDVALSEELMQINEVVVTALGVPKDKKALGYSVGTLDVESATEARDPNLVNTMQGKIAGVVVTKTSGGPGSSSRIVIRGNSSLVNNNQPLVVVDGMPIDNTTVGSGGTWGGIDFGSPISDINPDDVESMTILKGPSAAALYGSRALNGVIVIKTKSGKGVGQKWSVSLNSTTSFERANILKDFQNEYGAGTQGQFKYNDDGIPYFETARPSTPTFSSSWGPSMQGQTYIDWDGVQRTYSPQPDNYKDFFRTGTTLTNNVAVAYSGKHQARLSYTNLTNNGISPNSEFKRHNLNLNSGLNLAENVQVAVKLGYTRQSAFNRVNQSNGDNAARNIIMMPRNVSNESLQNYLNADGNENTWYTAWGWIANPYFVINRNINSDSRDRIIGNVQASWQVTDWLSVMGRTGGDYFEEERHQRFDHGSFIVSNGQFSDLDATFFERNSDFLITANKALGEEQDFTVNLGGSQMHQKRKHLDFFASELLGNDSYDLSDVNAENVFQNESIWEKKLNSLYASAQWVFRSFLYAEVTARNDWSSTLPKENNSYFYPSASLSYVFTDHKEWVNPKILSFGKIRAAVAEVGKDADPYLLQLLYDSVATYPGGIDLSSVHNPFPLVNLKPEKKRSIELGADLRFLQDRLSVDFTWYWESTTNQILTSTVSAASGFNSAIVNAGEITNQGIELLLKAVPVERENFSWQMLFNFTRNRNMVVSLHDQVDREVLGNQWRIDVTATEGLPYGALYGYGIQRDGAGQPLLRADGTFLRTEEPVYLGHINPDWRMGVTNEIQAGRFFGSFLIDIKKGGKLYSATNMYMHGYAGNVTATLEGREDWYASELARIAAGVDAPEYDADGNYITNWNPQGGYAVSGTYAEGTIINGEDVSGQSANLYLNPETYWSQHAQWTNEIHEPFVYDASFVKLREVRIGYRFPNFKLKKLGINDLKVSAVGRNLWLIYSGVPNVDPEASYTNGNGQGVEYATFPIIRSVGINLSAKF
jgi:TonB-linked SusC/RagA family outer membrane protein